jgi:hypothetical protein
MDEEDPHPGVSVRSGEHDATCRSILRLLLELEPDLIASKSASASALGALADVAGRLSAIILRENGEETFQDVLKSINDQIDQSAHKTAQWDAQLGHTHRGTAAVN